MLRKIFRFLLFGVLALAFLVGGFFLYGLSLKRELPWQSPVFDTERPADPGTIGPKGVLVFSKTNGFRSCLS